MNKKQNKKGYIAIEAVIVGAVVLLAGIASLMPFSSRMLDARTKLMGVFGMGEVNTDNEQPIVYDTNGYDISLNIKMTDITPLSNFKLIDMGSYYLLEKYLGLETSVIIPSKGENNKPIEVIGDSAFTPLYDEDGMDMINSYVDFIAIPNTVTTIHRYAFAGNNLTSIIIPDSVTFVGEGAFSYNKLESIKLSNRLTEIGENVFASNRIRSVVIPDGVVSIGTNNFTASYIETLEIPNSVKYIGHAAFSGTMIKNLTIPKGVESIGMGAFGGNRYLTKVVVSESVK